MIFEILLYTLITGFVIGALIPLLPEQIWWLRAWTYPRLQIAIINTETNAAWRERMTELEARYPHTYLLDLENYNGMLFYAKFPIKSVQERYLV